MGMVAIPGGGLWMPSPYGEKLGSFSGFTINNATRKDAFIIQVPKAGTLDTFEWRTGSVANTPDNGIKCSFQDVDLATGDPDGVIDQFRVITGTITANTWQVPGVLTSDGTDTGTKRSVTRGQLLACVIEMANFVAADSFDVDHLPNLPTSTFFTFPKVTDFTTVWSENASVRPLFVLKYSDGTYAYLSPLIMPLVNWVSVSRNLDSTPDETALRFKVPFVCTVDGCWLPSEFNVDTEIRLYDAADTVLTSVTVDKNVWEVGAYPHLGTPLFDAPVTLQPNQVYRLAQRPLSAAASNLHKGFDVQAAALLDAYAGQDFFWSERTDLGAWTDTPTRMMLAGLHITEIEVPTLTELRSPIRAALGW